MIKSAWSKTLSENIRVKNNGLLCNKHNRMRPPTPNGSWGSFKLARSPCWVLSAAAAASDPSRAIMVVEKQMQELWARNCRAVGKNIAHCPFQIAHCLAETHCLAGRARCTSFLLQINGQCVMRNGQCFFPRSGFWRRSIVALFTQRP